MYSITLQNAGGDNVIGSGDKIGRINFAASAESDGGAATYIASYIACEAEGSFTSSSNPAGITFATSSSDSLPATGRLNISSDGNFLPIASGQYDLGSSSFPFRNLYLDGGYVTAPTGVFDVISFNVDNESILSKGQISWDDTEGTMDIGLTDNTTIHIGEHRYYRVRNETGSVLYKGQVVYATGVHSNGLITPDLYVADGTIREIRFMGIVLEDVNNNNNGYALDFGQIIDMDLDGSASNYAVGDETWAAGDILYVHPTVAGKLTKVEPKHSISVAIVLDPGNGNGNGRMFVRPTSYGHLNDNHDVNVSGVLNNQFLVYDSITDYWQPSSGLYYVDGDLGIGTASPSNKLHVTDDTRVSNIVIGSSAYGADTNYEGLTHLSFPDQSEDYMIISNGQHTLVSSAGNTYVRASGNDGGHQLLVTPSVTYLQADNNYLAMRNSSTILNEYNNNVDLQVKGENDDNLIYADANNDKVGIGTATPPTKFHINAEVLDDGNYSYDTNSLMVVHQTPTSNTTLNDPKDILYLARQGTAAEAFGSAAVFSLSRYENSSTNSRTRLDIDLAHGNFLHAKTKVMTMRSDGNVGIGTASPTDKLTVEPANDTTDLTAITMRRNSSWGGSYGNKYLSQTWRDSVNTVAAIGARYDGTSVNLDFHSMYNGTYKTSSDVVMSIHGDGNVGIGTASPSSKLTVYDDNGFSSFRLESASSYAYSLIKHNSSTQWGYLEFNNDSSNRAFVQQNGSVTSNWGGPNALSMYNYAGPIVFGTNTTNSYIERMSINASGKIVINEGGLNSDFRVEGLTDEQLLFTDASTDRVGIGAPSPSEKLDIRYPASGGMALIKDSDSNDGLLFGDMAYSVSNGYQGIKHVGMTSSYDYMMISEGTNTLISARYDGSVYIRGGGNFATNEIRVYPDTGGVVINEYGANSDFRVEGDTDQNLIRTDASADSVGIGTPSPSSKLHVSANTKYGLNVVQSGVTNNNVGLFQFTGGNVGSTSAGSALLRVSSNSSFRPLASFNDTTVITAGGRVGIGTASPSEKLDVDGTIRTRTGGIGHEDEGCYIAYPGGGTYNDFNITQTGYLKITLPVSWTSTMVAFDIDIYEYTTQKIKKFRVGGYNYTPSTQWINTSAMMDSDNDFAKYLVRFGHDGTKCAIYISEKDSNNIDLGSSTTWDYCKVSVSNFFGGWSNTTTANWADGWEVGFTTTLGTITGGTIEVSRPYRQHDTSYVFNEYGGNVDFRIEGDTDQNLLFTDASTDRVGIGTASPSQKLDIRYVVGGGMALIKHSDSNDGLLFGDMALSANNSYQGIKHVAMAGISDYMMISDGGDTYISSKDGSSTFIRAGGNTTTYQIQVAPTFMAVGATAESMVINSAGVVFNEAGSNRDFRVEGDTDPNLLFTDASTDRVGIGTASPSSKLDINADTVRLRNAKTPSSASDTGNTGDICWDSNYVYVCVATNTWKRSPLSTW